MALKSGPRTRAQGDRGHAAPRREDKRLLSGTGRYIADIHLSRCLEVAFLRSQVPHAQIVRIDASAALALPGVHRVITADDLLRAGVTSVPDFPDWAKQVATYPLARGRVRYVGSPIAAIVADDRYIAEDALELVEVEVEPLGAIGSIEEALADGAELLYPEWGDNLCVDAPSENAAADSWFDRLRVVAASSYTGRHMGCPMECRGVAAEFRDDRLTIWSSTQLPHIARNMFSRVLNLSERQIRVVAPDVGGAFGLKAQVYPEEYVVGWLACELRRPVRFLEDRYEHLVSAAHARDTRVDLEAAVHEDGRVEAVRGTVWQDLGSGEIFPNGFDPAFVAAGSVTSSYRVSEQKIRVAAIVTTKTPNGAYRGFGAPEGAFAMERLLDTVADELAIDRREIRRRNLIRPEDIPFETSSGGKVDSGSHIQCFERALELGRAAYAELTPHYQADSELRLGLGVATCVKGTAATFYSSTGHWLAQDSCRISFAPDGSVTIGVGISAYGQGSETMVAGLAALLLGVEPEAVRVTIGDTDTAPLGLGSWSSRGTTVVAGSMELAAAPLRQKGLAIAASLLEAPLADLELREGRFSVRGSAEPFVTWADVCEVALVRTDRLPEGTSPGLDASGTYDPPVDHEPNEEGRMNACLSYPNMAHVAIVEVDRRSGVVRPLRYVVVHDCGFVVNPAIVQGQMEGGVVQGIAGALYEECAYDGDVQPTSTTFMEYLLPTAVEAPSLVVEHIGTRSPSAPLGVKGVGESGIVGPAAAIAGAIEHALRDDGCVPLMRTPITPGLVRASIAAAQSPTPP